MAGEPKIYWCNHASRVYGMVQVHLVVPNSGTGSPVAIYIGDDAIDVRKTVFRQALPDVPIGLETAPQLDLRLRLTDRVKSSGLLADLMQSNNVIVLVVGQSPDIRAGKPVIRAAPYTSALVPTSNVVYFIGAINKAIEVDLIKDDDTRLVADEIAHYTASQGTFASELLAKLQSYNGESDANGLWRRTNGGKWYELHASSEIAIGNIGGTEVRNIAYFDPFNLTRFDIVFLALASVVADRVFQLLPSYARPTISAAISTPPLVIGERRNTGSTTLSYLTHQLYVQTDYRDSDAAKQRWGLVDWVARQRSLRDAMKDMIESLLHQATLRVRAYSSSMLTVGFVARQVLETASGLDLPAGTYTSHKLNANVISTCEITTDAWASDRMKDYSVSAAKRYNDFGSRLAMHNVALDVEKWYARPEGSYLRITPDSNYYRNELRGIYAFLAGGDYVRPMRVRPQVVRDANNYAGDSFTVDGRAYSFSLTSPPTLSEDMRYTTARGVLDLFGKSQSLLEYDVAQWRGSMLGATLGTKYATDYVVATETNLYSGRATWRMMRYAD